MDPIPHTVVSPAQNDSYYPHSLQHLRLLRHPSIVKFLGCDASHDQILLVTEPVIPVLRALGDTPAMDSVVMGWRGLGAGLDFLHQKANLSHNNLSTNCVYVNVLDSQWKLGGFEAACAPKAINRMVRRGGVWV